MGRLILVFDEFKWQIGDVVGVGHITADVSQDVSVVQGIVVASALTYVLVNLAADFVHAWLDPRLREKLS